jgi:hypothetical protein
MSGPAPGGGKRLFPNPFYVLLLAASVLFVLTTFGYLVAPLVHVQAGAAGADARGPAAWLDRNAPTALGAEFAVMLAAGLLAMATDRWFPAKPAPTRKDPPGG